MKILVLNCGSSSLKYQLYATDGSALQPLEKGLVEKIGNEGGVCDHRHAVQIIFERLQRKSILSSLSEIDAVGHRIVHGGEKFQSSILMNEEIANSLEEISELAPLHNPINLLGYAAAHALLPEAKHVAVFDTAFHSTLPQYAYLYGLPYRFYAEEKIRRYGFHGISHRYLWERYKAITGGSNHKIITCHLGNGCSTAAIDSGRSLDTSMGFTPLEGLLMGTRGGDLDPGVILHLMRSGLQPEELEELLNYESGLKGLSGLTSDMRELIAAAQSGNQQAAMAITVFCYRIRKSIGAYAAAMNGLNSVIFSGGIGEHSDEIRSRVCSELTFMGIAFDAQMNLGATGTEKRISSKNSAVDVWVIPTDEEIVIAEDTLRCIQVQS